MSPMDAPLAAAQEKPDIASAVSAYIATARALAADGLTWSEFGHLLVSLLRLAVRMADSLQATGPEKKTIVMTAAAALFDAVAGACVPVVLSPVWLFTRAATRALVLALAAGAVESILPVVRSA